MMEMRAAFVATNSLPEQVFVTIAAESNASVATGSASMHPSPFLAVFVTGIKERGASVQGPQEPPGPDPGNEVNTKSVAWFTGLESP